METEEEKFRALVKKYKSGNCNSDEIAWLESWYLNLNESDKAGLSRVELDEGKLLMWDIIEPQSTAKSGIRLWPRLAVGIAAAAATIVFGIWFFSAPRLPELTSGVQIVQNDIAPGKNTATLTLSNGKVIKLSDTKNGIIVGGDKLVYNDGSSVHNNQKSSDHTGTFQPGAELQLTAATPRGGTYAVTLPDGSKVWLNAASTLKFPSTFVNAAIRKVELSGEAYFEVHKDKKHPFIVASAGQQVQVLGTHFNINAYHDESDIKTTLLEGSVMVSSYNKQKSQLILKPGQQSELNTIGLSARSVDVDEAVAWKEGKFFFENTPIEIVMRQVERWYNVDVVYSDVNLKQKTLSGSVSKYDKVSGLLKAIGYTKSVKFRIEGRKIIVMPYK